MSKRAAADLPTSSAKASRNGLTRESAVANDEMGEFEDAWEDEIEDDVIGEEDAEEGLSILPTSYHVIQLVKCTGMDVDDVMPPIEESEEKPSAPNVFLPGVHQLGKDEILEPDDSVYIIRHSMNVNWPCLSFDVLRDNLGDQRQRYPATAYLVAGTQADVAKNNELTVYKLSSLHRTQKDGGETKSFVQ